MASTMQRGPARCRGRERQRSSLRRCNVTVINWVQSMQLNFEKSADGIMEIRLEGRLDTTGAEAVELRFSALTGGNPAVIIDLSGVEFLTSLGIRLLLQGAKTVRSKHGKLVLLQPSERIQNVLKAAGIDALIPVYQDREAATAAVLT